MGASVAVVIPTYNGGAEFRRTLEMIRAQELDRPVDLMVIDSGSTDGTPEMARQHGARVHVIQPREFNHGATRNQAIGLSRGAYVALTVQDAVPVDRHWLAALVQNLDRHPGAAGVYSRQVPRPGCDPFTRHQLETWWTGSGQWRLQRIEDWDAYARLGPAQQQALATFDNVSSCLRRSVWEQFPFRPVRFGEDLFWSHDVLRAGWAIIYEPASAVVHSHDRSAWYELKRHYQTHKLLKGLFGMHTVPRLARVPRNLLGEMRQRWAFLRRHGVRRGWPYWRAVALSGCSQLGQYLGGQADRLLVRWGRWFARLDRLLSRGV